MVLTLDHIKIDRQIDALLRPVVIRMQRPPPEAQEDITSMEATETHKKQEYKTINNHSRESFDQKSTKYVTNYSSGQSQWM